MLNVRRYHDISGVLVLLVCRAFDEPKVQVMRQMPEIFFMRVPEAPLNTTEILIYKNKTLHSVSEYMKKQNHADEIPLPHLTA